MSEPAAAEDEEVRARAPGLWRNAEFVKLWLAANVSLLGSHVTALALPLLAVQTLQATAGQMGFLRAASSVAAGLAGPFAGVLADRLRRRPFLISTDLGLAFLAALIALAAWAGALRIEHLYALQFVWGALSICGDVASMAYLPSVVRRGQLVEANSKLQATASAVTIAGPGLAGVLVQALTAPVAMLFDAASFVLSALSLKLIRAPEPGPTPAAERRGVWAEMFEGLSVVYRHALLRPLAQGIALHFLFAGMVSAIFVLYAVRELGLSAAQLGLVMAGLGPGFLAGALLAPWAARRFGVGRVLVYSPLLVTAGGALVAAAAGSVVVIILTLVAGHVLLACGIQLHGINLMSLRQAVTPHRLQGRMNASFRFVNLAAAGVGALAAGWLGEAVGLQATLGVAAGGFLFHCARLFFSPIRALRETPEEVGSRR